MVLNFCNLSCCISENIIPSLHFGRHATSWTHCSHFPPAMYFNLILSFNVSLSHFSHLGRTGVISPHQMVKTEPLNTCKELTVPGLFIISWYYYHLSNSYWFWWGLEMYKTLERCVTHCKPSLSGCLSLPLFLLFFKSISVGFFFFSLLSPSLLQAWELTQERTNPKIMRFSFLPLISVLIIIILTLNLLHYKNDFMQNLMNLNIHVR